MAAIQQTMLGSGFGFIFTPAPISANSRNYDFRAAAAAAGWDGATPLIATVTLSPGIILGSNSVGAYAFDTGTTPYPSGSRLDLTVNGYIVGRGGDGASGIGYDQLRPGSPGGPAMRVNLPVNLYGGGFIGGGGGGQGRSGYGGNNGGSGAGGAGDVPGTFGPTTETPAGSGTLLSGGTTLGGHPNGRGNQPNPAYSNATGITLGQDGDVGSYGAAGGRGGNSIDGVANISVGGSVVILGRTT